MKPRIVLTAAVLACCCACSQGPEWVAPPVQYAFSPDNEPRLVNAFVSMDDGLMENYVISGVLGGAPGSPWRWANEKVNLRFQLGDLKAGHFVVDFVIPHSTFELTGPVVMSLQFDGKPAGTRRVDKPGEQHWALVLDHPAFDPVTPVVVTLEVDKFYTSETDGTKLGFMLQRAGFQP